MSKLRVGVIGYGPWGKVHLQAYRRHPHVELAAVLGRSPSGVRAVAAAFGAVGYTDLKAFLGSGLDLVSVVLPDADHFELTAAVLQAGIPCFAEKPLAMDLDEGRKLLLMAEKHGVPFGINFNHRFAPAMHRALDLVSNGSLGTPAYLAWKFSGGHFPEMHPSLAHLIYMQSHAFNMLSLLGGSVAEVTCVGAAPRGDASLTSAAVTMRFERGGIGVLLASVDGSYHYPHVLTLEIVGTGGRVLVDDAIASCTFHAAGSDVGEVWKPGFFDDDARSFAMTTERHIHSVVEAMRHDQPFPIPATEGWTALVLGKAAIVACEEHRIVRPQEIG